MPTYQSQASEENYEGATVIEPVKGEHSFILYIKMRKHNHIIEKWLSNDLQFPISDVKPAFLTLEL